MSESFLLDGVQRAWIAGRKLVVIVWANTGGNLRMELGMNMGVAWTSSGLIGVEFVSGCGRCRDLEDRGRGQIPLMDGHHGRTM